MLIYVSVWLLACLVGLQTSKNTFHLINSHSLSIMMVFVNRTGCQGGLEVDGAIEGPLKWLLGRL